MPPNTPGFVPGLGVQQPSQIPQIVPTPNVPVNYPTGMFVQLVRLPYRTTYVLYGFCSPGVVDAAFLASHIRTNVARSPVQARQTHSSLRAPSVVAPGIVFQPVSTSLSPPPRVASAQRYRLYRPASIGAAVVFQHASVSNVRTPRSRFQAYSRLSPPSVVGAGIVFSPVQTVALTPRSRFSFWSRLSAPPKILSAVQPLAQPIRVSVVRTPLARFRTVRRLAPPAAVGGTIAPVVARISKFLATQPTQTRHVGRFGVASPQIVNLPPTQVTLSVRFATHSRLGRRSSYRISRPIVVTAPKPSFDQTRLRVSYTRSHRISRGAHNTNLRAPTAIGAALPPVTPTAQAPTWSAFRDTPDQRYGYTAPELWYGEKPPPRRKK